MVLVRLWFVSHKRQASVSDEMVVLKNAVPSGPMLTLVPLEASAARGPRSYTNASPVTSVQLAPGVARTRTYQSWPGSNCDEFKTKPSEPTSAEPAKAFPGVGRSPNFR